MKWRRNIGVLLLAVLVAGGLGYGFWPKPVPMDMAEVSRGPLVVSLQEEGRTRVRDRYVISAPIAGYLRRITLEVGDPVTGGQVVATLEPLRSTSLDPRSRAEAQARVTAAEAAVKAAEEEVRAAGVDAELARREYDRRKRLCQVECISEEEVERAGAEARRSAARLRSAEFNVEVASSELEAARTALRYAGAAPEGQDEQVVIRAPVDGRVLKRYLESEGVVQPGQALLEVGDPAAIEVEVDVLSADAVGIAPGTRVLLERWGGPEALEARVRRVEPVGFTKVSALGVEEQRVLVIADITSPRELWLRLGDGYRVEARFILWEAEDVLQVPASALFREAGAWAVFTVEEGRARRRGVEVGERNGLSAEIKSGLKAGETVIAHPDNQTHDGLRVRSRS